MTPRLTIETAGESVTLDYSLERERTFLPQSFKTLQELLDYAADRGISEAVLPRRADATLPDGRTPFFVEWPTLKPDDWDLENQWRAMVEGQVLVKRERVLPYPILMADGFAASGVRKIIDESAPAAYREQPVSATFRGKNARTWFAASRMRKGMLGLGPGAVLEPTEWDGGGRFPQKPDSTNKQKAYYEKTTGERFEIKGNQEKLIDHSGSNPLNARPVVGNITLRGRNFAVQDNVLVKGKRERAGIAYHGIVANDLTVFNFLSDGGWRGHGWSPNGETGALGVGGMHDIMDSTFDTKDVLPYTSLLMSNGVRDGSRIDGLRVLNPSGRAFGGLVRWGCTGRHIWRDVHLPKGTNVNIEANYADFELEIIGGSMYGGLNVRSPYGSVKITIRDVDRPDGSPWRVTVWVDQDKETKLDKEKRTQLASDIQVFDKAGNRVPVIVGGALAGTTG